MFATVIMDLDGTLVDSVPDVTLALNAALAAQGLAGLATDDVKGMVGGGARVLVERALASVGGDAALCDTVMQGFIDGYREAPAAASRLYPGAIEAIEALRARGCKLGICTNKPEATTFPVLRAFELERYFPVIVCGDSLPYRKPDRRHLLHVIAALDARPENSVYVGDSGTDVAAAHNAAIPVVLVSHGYTTTPVQALGADAVIEHFDDLLPALETLAATAA